MLHKLEFSALENEILIGRVNANPNDSPFAHPEWRTTYTQSFLMVVSLGYFIHDLEWIISYQREDKLMMAHHIYSVLALFRMLFKGYSGGQATCALGSMEITNPFLQARWFIRSEGMYPSILHTSVETTFMIVFFLVRILFGTYLMIIILKQPENDWDFIFLTLAIYLMSWIFFINMIKYVFVKYFGIRTTQELRDKNK
ncbi:hypothetical protein NQ317_008835 [Molorchus minor]|uniref:TLC domain-containing protein n=1 Tax=Molorchus minor TaxID=1323400 RepID=A0ABQ9IYC2_9CUCU|nr:hypothetical protein NQ317_008835 [Molorchus minor]